MKNYQINHQSAAKELTKIGDWIRWSVSVFNEAKIYLGHGTDNAWDEAVHLVLQILHLPLDADPKIFDTVVLPYERDRLLKVLQERVEKRKPLPYITHQAWCLGVPFYVDERVLIPRSPFAEWIEKHFEPWIDPAQVSDILEIGTGSGYLAIMATLYFPEAHCDAVDINNDALAVAAINVEKHEVEDQVKLIHSDVFSAIPENQQYDIIFSNPPYVSSEEMTTLPPEYQYEPKNALEAPEQGLAVVIKILQSARHYLRAGGILVVEVGNSAQALQAYFPDIPFTWLEQERGGHGLFLLTKEQLVCNFNNCKL